MSYLYSIYEHTRYCIVVDASGNANTESTNTWHLLIASVDMRAKLVCLIHAVLQKKDSCGLWSRLILPYSILPCPLLTTSSWPVAAIFWSRSRTRNRNRNAPRGSGISRGKYVAAAYSTVVGTSACPHSPKLPLCCMHFNGFFARWTLLHMLEFIVMYGSDVWRVDALIFELPPLQYSTPTIRYIHELAALSCQAL